MKRAMIIVGMLVVTGGAAYIVRSHMHESATAQPARIAIEKTVDALTGFGALEKKREIADPQLAVIRAKAIFQKLQAEQFDFSRGPCIAEDLMPNWVADVVHNPRTALDDLPENQCQAFAKGSAQHFVELDMQGEAIRIY